MSASSPVRAIVWVVLGTPLLLAPALLIAYGLAKVGVGTEARPASGLAVHLALTQAALLAVAWIGARRASEGLRERLGLVRPIAPATTLSLAVVGSFAVMAAGGLLALALHALGVLPDNEYALQRHVLDGLQAAPWPGRVGLVLLLAFGPGVCEELLFRGFLQRRLLEHWPPAPAIFVAGSLFALLHLDVTHVVSVLPLAYWLGYVAARTRSIVPAIACHAAINGVATALQSLAESESTAAGVILVAWLATSAFALVAAILRLEMIARAQGGRPPAQFPKTR